MKDENIPTYELNDRWLRDPDNRAKHKGEWVVLRRGKLLDHGLIYTQLYHRWGNMISTGNLIVRVE